MPGPPPKPPERRQGRHRNDFGTLEPSRAELEPAMPLPDPPPGMLKATERQWVEFWQSEVATLVATADLPALRRLYSLYDERARCLASGRRNRLVEGSQGQPVMNPLYKHMATLDGEILALEDRFGLTPMARLKLGVTFGAAKRSLTDLVGVPAPTDDDLDDDDPRILDVEPIEG